MGRARKPARATKNADCAESVVDVAVGIQDALSGDPPYEPGEKSNNVEEGMEWQLLDEESDVDGGCKEQAELMKLAVNMLGVQATTELVCASDPDGETPYDCLDWEHRWCQVHSPAIEEPEFLLLDFGGEGYWEDMNEFEGCCVVDGYYYAVWPTEIAASDYDMLVTLGGEGVTQHYCWWDEELQIGGWWHPCSQPGSTPDIP